MKTGPNEKSAAFRSLREAAHQVDNEKDFRDYVLSHAPRVGTESTPVRYERHPVSYYQVGGH
jgi:hypothetical protein